MKLHELVDAYLHDNRITRKAWAREVGVSQASVTRWLNGEKMVDGHALARILRWALGEK